MPLKDFRDHFWLLQKKLKAGEPFAFSRYSDGEMDVMQNKKVELTSTGTFKDGKRVGITYGESDHKEYDPEKHAWFHERLLTAYRHHQDNYFVGLSCPCCVGPENNAWMKEQRGGDDDELTWANLFVNSNYPLFLTHVLPLLEKKKVFLVCNEAATFDGLPFEVEKDFRIGSNAMIRNIGLVEEMKEVLSKEEVSGAVFLFAAASLSNILIHELFSSFPENTYIDIGTTLNPHLGLPVARNYLKGYWKNSGNTEIYKVCKW
jgi:hypothetical protein